jgi:hypothetical protein
MSLTNLSLDVLSQLINTYLVDIYSHKRDGVDEKFDGVVVGGFYCSVMGYRCHKPVITLLACFDKTLNFKILTVLNRFAVSHNVCDPSWILSLAKNLKKLNYYYIEKQKFILPQNITYLKFNWFKKDGVLDGFSIFPKTITSLIANCSYNTINLHSFPPNLTKLKTDQAATESWIKALPQTIVYVAANGMLPFVKLFLGMKQIESLGINVDYDHTKFLPEMVLPNLLSLKFTVEKRRFSDCEFQEQKNIINPVFPTSLVHLDVQLTYFDEKVFCNLNQLVSLKLTLIQNIFLQKMPLVLPSSLLKLEISGFGIDLNEHLLPKNLTHFKTTNYIPISQLKLLPRGLKILAFDLEMSFLILNGQKIDNKFFADLPPNLTNLSLHGLTLQNDILSNLPQSLVNLAVNNTSPDIIFDRKSLPKSLTCLRTYFGSSYLDANSGKLGVFV